MRYSSDETDTEETAKRQSPSVEPNLFESVLSKLAELSLRDYSWRSNVFKSNEADRLERESLARMLGEDNPTYLRPMHASEENLGPLGTAERDAVSWLSSVIEEEASRARKIAESDGKTLVRPIDLKADSPLSGLENQVVGFLARIRGAERERVLMGTLARPMDLTEEKRGPLGDAEASLVEKLGVMLQSEWTRFKTTVERNGDLVRPMDVPGPLGEWEKGAMDIVTAEKKRMNQRIQAGDGKIIRPKDASWDNPLGWVETKIDVYYESIIREEEERLKNIKRALEENRPMERSERGLAGFVEAGLVRVVSAIKELLQNLREEKTKDFVLRVNATLPQGSLN